METIDLINALTEAHRILEDSKRSLVNAPQPLFNLAWHAQEHISKQIAALLAPDPEPVAPLDLNARLRASIKAEDWRDRETCPDCHEYNVNCTCEEETQPEGRSYDESDVERMAE